MTERALAEDQAEDQAEGTAHQFEVIAGAACLDFANTVGGRRGGHTEEYLGTYGDLVRWGSQAGVLSAEETSRLMREAREHPDEAGRVLARAVALREAIYGIFTALVEGAEPTASDLGVLNAELAHALRHMALAHTADGFAWQWTGDERAQDAMLWRVARSAADLLLAPTAGSVRQCASETCSWLFVDTTRNRSRRWCDMRGCGNRAKVHRHRARRRADQGASAAQ